MSLTSTLQVKECLEGVKCSDEDEDEDELRKKTGTTSLKMEEKGKDLDG